MAGNVNQAAGAYDKQAQAIRAAADAVGKLELLFGDMQLAALTAIKPVTDLISKIPAESRVEAMTKAFQALGVAIAVAFGVTAVKGVIAFASALRVIAISNPWLLALTAAGGAAAYLGFDKLMGGESEDVEQTDEIGKIAKGAANRDIELSQRDKMIQKYKELIRLAEQAGALDKSNIWLKYDAEQRLLDIESRRYQLSTNQYNQAKLTYDIDQRYAEVVANKEAALREATKQYELSATEEKAQAKKLLDIKIKYIDENYDYEIEKLNAVAAKRQEIFQQEVDRQKSWEAGWNEAFKRYTETAEKASLRGEAAFDAVVSNMETMLRNFVETGKLNFKDFVGSVIKDLLYMEMKAQATMIFRQIWGSFSASFGFNKNSANNIGLAAGGPIDSPRLVGENGPELFVPRTPGTIIPQGSWQQMASSGGGGLTVNGNYIANMSAIDTQSATQFLASNKQTIWAAYQSANRMVPISR
jgi:lambda family phage tail tape measure protein